nr:ribonuclease H-like domain-containing protein [Tanacetum cinerariifolium]
MLKTEEYDLWSMRMEQYLTYTYYPLWEAQKLARKNELKAKSTLLLAIPDEHLLKFHSIKDAKSLWEAINIRFGGNKESKKMHKTILKQQYENFEDANRKLLRSLPLTWNNIALIMRNKPDIETLSMDDLYNNLKVYEAEIKGQSSPSSNSHNVAFVSSENTSNINETVNAAHDIPAAGSKEKRFASSYVDDIDTDDLEEIDLKWQLAMITMRVKKFIKKTGRNLNFNGNEPVGFNKTRVECYNFHRRGHFARDCRTPRNQGNRSGDNERRVVLVETPASALVVQDGLGGYDWSYQAEEGPTDFALMAHSSDSVNSSNSEVQSCSNECLVSEIDEDKNQAKDRYKVRIGYHAVPPPYTWNYMPPRADLSFAGLDDSLFKFKISETRTSVNENESIASKPSEEIREEPKTVRSSAPIIEDWESDSEDKCEDKTS